MSELDHLREEVAYLKFWLGIVVVTDISLAGWLLSSSDTAAPYTVFFAVMGLILLSAGIVGLASKNRAAHREDQGVIAMELIAAIAMFGVVLVIVGVALDAARRAK
jgi:hypothetical protein